MLLLAPRCVASSPLSGRHPADEVVLLGAGHWRGHVKKWSDDWLANVDCNGDGKLDRGLTGTTSTGTSMGWVTNHFEGDYMGSDGEMHHYTYFVKIAYDNGLACGKGEPTCIWGLYTIIEELQNDLFGGYGGRIKFVNKLTGPGLGQF
jgi:hypothetical protein